MVGVFGYSDEDGTEAEGLDAKLPDDVVAERVERLDRAGRGANAQRAEERVGESGSRCSSRSVDARGRPTVAIGRAEHQGPDVDGVCLLPRVAEARCRSWLVRRGRRRRRRGGRHRVDDLMSESRCARCAPARSPRGAPPTRPRRVDPASPVVPPTGPSAWNIANALTVLRIAARAGLRLAAARRRRARTRTYRWPPSGCSPSRGSPTGSTATSPAAAGLVTNFGKVVDPIADKALMGMALVGLSMLGEVLVVGDHRRAGARVRHHGDALLW